MLRFVLAVIVLAVGVQANAADFVFNGSNGFMLVENGRHDGWLYQRFKNCRCQTLSCNHDFHYRRGSRLFGVANGYHPPLGALTQSQLGGHLGNNWRSLLLQQAAKQQEQNEVLKALQILGFSNAGYGTSGFAQNHGSLLSNHYGVSQNLFGYGSGLGPLQQLGDTVYGNYNSYNAVADPYRRFDIGATLNSLTQLAEQVEAGSIQVRSDTAKTLRQAIDSYRSMEESKIRMQGAVQLMREIRALLESNNSVTIRATRKNGKVEIERMDGGKPPQEQPNGGSPSDRPPPTGGAGTDDALKKVGQLVTNMRNNCLRCHGGPATIDGQKLILGDENGLRLADISERQEEKIADRVGNGTMPPGGGLPQAERDLYEEFFGKDGR